jgi:hypothetical protein
MDALVFREGHRAPRYISRVSGATVARKGGRTVLLLGESHHPGQCAGCASPLCLPNVTELFDIIDNTITVVRSPEVATNSALVEQWLSGNQDGRAFDVALRPLDLAAMQPHDPALVRMLEEAGRSEMSQQTRLFLATTNTDALVTRLRKLLPLVIRHARSQLGLSAGHLEFANTVCTLFLNRYAATRSEREKVESLRRAVDEASFRGVARVFHQLVYQIAIFLHVWYHLKGAPPGNVLFVLCTEVTRSIVSTVMRDTGANIGFRQSPLHIEGNCFDFTRWQFWPDVEPVSATEPRLRSSIDSDDDDDDLPRAKDRRVAAPDIDLRPRRRKRHDPSDDDDEDPPQHKVRRWDAPSIGDLYGPRQTHRRVGTYSGGSPFPFLPPQAEVGWAW